MVWPAHIEWLKNKFAHRLLDRLQPEPFEIDDVIARFVAADPTPGKALVDWMIKGFCSSPQAFRWEDVSSGEMSRVRETLVWFASFFSELTVDQKNIYSYPTLASVYKTIEPKILQAQARLETQEPDSVSSREIKRRQREKIFEQSIILDRSDTRIVAVPLTEEASKWWGRGTQWCTAAEKNNYFSQYNSKAPLIVMIIEGEKYQLWTDEKDFQFMNAIDESVNPQIVQERWSDFEPVIRWAQNKSWGVLPYLPLEEITPDMCMKAIEDSLSNLEIIPNQFITQELVDKVLEKARLSPSLVDVHGIAKYLPQNFKNQAVWEFLVGCDAALFRRMPEEFITESFCKKIVEVEGNLLECVPLKFRSEAVCLCAMSSQYEPRKYDIVQAIPVEKCSESFLLKSFYLYKRGMLYSFQDLERVGLLSEKVLDASIDSQATYFHGFPKNYLNSSRYLKFIQKSSDSIKDMPKKLLNQEHYLAALKNDVGSIEYVPKKYLTREICLDIIKNTCITSIIDYMPKKLLTPDFFKEMLDINSLFISSIPIKFWKREHLLDAIEYDPSLFKSINQVIQGSKERKDLEVDWNNFFIEKIMKDTRKYLRHAPPNILTKEFVWSIIHNKVEDIIFIPRNYLTEDMLLYSLEKAPELKNTIAKEAMTKRICDKIYEIDPKTAYFTIPREFRSDYLKKNVDVGWSSEILQDMFVETIQPTQFVR